MSQKWKNRLVTLLCVALIVCGVGWLVHGRILNMVARYQQMKAADQPISQKAPQHAHYNAKAITDVDDGDIAKAMGQGHTPVIGKIAVPALGIKLPVFAPASGQAAYNDMLYGACEVKGNQTMGGKCNYGLASHHMLGANLCFTPLMHAKVGQIIYLTNGKRIYKYRINKVFIVNASQTTVLENQGHKRMVTLVTCTSYEHVNTRKIVQGKYMGSRPFKSKWMHYFKSQMNGYKMVKSVFAAWNEPAQ